MNPYQTIRLAKIDLEQTCRDIGDWVIERVRAVHANGAVIGLSGGVDSLCAAAIIQKAFKSSSHKLELTALLLPSAINNPADVEDGERIAQRLGLSYKVISIEEITEAYRHQIPDLKNHPLHLGNMMSRIRANVLSTEAALQGKIVAGTGNKDEDFGIGYYTLFGDGAVHMSPIAVLSKRLVREVASYLGFEDIAHREPAAGLEPNQSDFRDLGYRYALVELVTEGLSQGVSLQDLYSHPQVLEQAQENESLYIQKFGAKKFSSAKEMLDDLLRRHEVAKKKMEIIHPPTPSIQLQY